MSLVTNASSLRCVLAYGDLPASGNVGDQIIVASLGCIASWPQGASSWSLDPVNTVNSVAVLADWSNLSGVDGMGSNAAPLAGVNTSFAAVYAKINALIAALQV